MRVHSECMTSEVFGSLKCDCKDQLDAAMAAVARAAPAPSSTSARRGGASASRTRSARTRSSRAGTTPSTPTASSACPTTRAATTSRGTCSRHLGRGERAPDDQQPGQGRRAAALGVRVVGRVPVVVAANRTPPRYLEAKRLRMEHDLPAVLARGERGRRVAAAPIRSRGMRIALTHNLRVTDSEEEAEFDSPETIAGDRARARTGRAPRRAVRRDGPRVAARHAARGVRAGHHLQPGRGAPRQDAARVLPRALRGARHPLDRQRRLHALRDARQGAHQEAARRLGRPEPARPLRHARVAPRRTGSTSCPSRSSRSRTSRARARASGRTASWRIRSRSGACSTSCSSKYPDGALVERYVPGIDVRVVLVEGLPPLPPVETIVDPGYSAALRDPRLPPREPRHAVRRAPRARAPARRRRGAPAGPGRPHAVGLRDAGRRPARLPRGTRRRGLLPERDRHPELRARGRALRGHESRRPRLRRDGPAPSCARPPGATVSPRCSTRPSHARRGAAARACAWASRST